MEYNAMPIFIQYSNEVLKAAPTFSCLRSTMGLVRKPRDVRVSSIIHAPEIDVTQRVIFSTCWLYMIAKHFQRLHHIFEFEKVRNMMGPMKLGYIRVRCETEMGTINRK